jgi:hypothetical protein
MRGLDPRIHRFRKKMGHRVSTLRAGSVMTPKARAHSVSTETECAPAYLRLSHFRTENRIPLFLKML